MVLNGKQANFVNKVQQLASNFVEVRHTMEVLANQWSDEFASGQANEISNDDLTDYGITTGNLEKIQTSFTEFEKFWDNQTVTAKAHGDWMGRLMNRYFD